MNPTENEVRIAICAVAARSLDGKPVGSIAMIDDVIGVKKMGFWWNWRVWGPIGAFTQLWRDWVVRRCEK